VPTLFCRMLEALHFARSLSVASDSVLERRAAVLHVPADVPTTGNTGKFDGMASFILDRSHIALVHNHGIDPKDRKLSAARGDTASDERLRKLPHFGKDGDGFVMPGGTATLIYNWRCGKMESQFLSPAGTTCNCSGGSTPWDSWLSGEESVMQTDDVERPHGLFYRFIPDKLGPLAEGGRLQPLLISDQPGGDAPY
jgi:Bacterial protein of unknown function (DUF839)